MTTKLGRRYDPTISQALFQAAERVMQSDGFSSLTIDGLVQEVGTTRPAFYRRYDSIARLALEVILDRFADAPPVETGSLRTDLLMLQRNDVAMMNSPIVVQNLPALLEAMRTDSEIRAMYLSRFIAPRRNNVAGVIAAAVGRGEIIDDSVDTEYVCDLLFGPLLSRTLLPTDLPVNDALARTTVDSALREFTYA